MNSILNGCIYKCICNHNLSYYALFDGVYVNYCLNVYTNEYTVINRDLTAATVVVLRGFKRPVKYGAHAAGNQLSSCQMDSSVSSTLSFSRSFRVPDTVSDDCELFSMRSQISG